VNDTPGAERRATAWRPRWGYVVVHDSAIRLAPARQGNNRRTRTRPRSNDRVGSSAPLRLRLVPAAATVTAATKISRRWHEEM
jgi:hypothetical protein